jgi:5-methylcytosine-specific restriction endonuclease McrA
MGGSERSNVTMSKVFVVDTNKQPLDLINPGHARLLLSQGKAAVLRQYPFTIVLKRAVSDPQTQPLRLKIDPGSKTTGMALVNDATGEVVFAAELAHRGGTIKKALDSRRAARRSRRQRKTRYRQPRFQNRQTKFHARVLQDRPWLPPSLESRLANITTWVQRLRRLAPIEALSQELVKFDLQQMEQLSIQGVEYQQGTLAGYEVREYLLEKWQRTCAYCGTQNVPLQIEHILAKANGGTNRVSNLTIACKTCNTAKGTQRIEDFLKGKPDVLKSIQTQAKGVLKDASAVNSTRWALYRRLLVLGLPVEAGTGGRTKFNRTTRELPKAHWIDAANVGESTPDLLALAQVVPLRVAATGHGSRKMCKQGKPGSPRTRPKGQKKVNGFTTGDMVRAVVSKGKKAGTYVGKVAIRSTGSFNITTKLGTVEGISHRFCTVLHHGDGYQYQSRRATPIALPKGMPLSSPFVEAQGYPEAEVR